jgi:dGTP triphosphohydrolase
MGHLAGSISPDADILHAAGCPVGKNIANDVVYERASLAHVDGEPPYGSVHGGERL